MAPVTRTAPCRGAACSKLGKDGDRATVIASYRDHYQPFKPSLLTRLGELRGKALGRWYALEPCHADVLVRELGNQVATIAGPDSARTRE